MERRDEYVFNRTGNQVIMPSLISILHCCKNKFPICVYSSFASKAEFSFSWRPIWTHHDYVFFMFAEWSFYWQDVTLRPRKLMAPRLVLLLALILPFSTQISTVDYNFKLTALVMNFGCSYHGCFEWKRWRRMTVLQQQAYSEVLFRFFGCFFYSKTGEGKATAFWLKLMHSAEDQHWVTPPTRNSLQHELHFTSFLPLDRFVHWAILAINLLKNSLSIFYFNSSFLRHRFVLLWFDLNDVS